MKFEKQQERKKRCSAPLPIFESWLPEVAFVKKTIGKKNFFAAHSKEVSVINEEGKSTKDEKGNVNNARPNRDFNNRNGNNQNSNNAARSNANNQNSNNQNDNGQPRPKTYEKAKEETSKGKQAENSDKREFHGACHTCEKVGHPVRDF